MRAERIGRVRQRLLEQAVADNVDTIRGLLPRSLRKPKRMLGVWLRRAPILLALFSLAGSTYFVANGSSPIPLGVTRAAIIPPAPATTEDHPASFSGFAAALSTRHPDASSCCRSRRNRSRCVVARVGREGHHARHRPPSAPPPRRKRIPRSCHAPDDRTLKLRDRAQMAKQIAQRHLRVDSRQLDRQTHFVARRRDVLPRTDE